MTLKTTLFALVMQVALLFCGAAAASPAAAEQGAYRYTLPPGWTRSVEAGVETLTPSAEPAGNAQALLLATKPLGHDFDAQFDAERSALEVHWGLSAPLLAAPQRGRTPAGQHAAHFASYASAGGPRYMSFLAMARNGKFSMLVFVAANDEAFNRLAPVATKLWQGLHVAP